MNHWLRSLVTCLSLMAFLLQNASALGACPHHDGADDHCAADDADHDGGDSDSDHPAHAPHAPCQGCVHCTIAKLPCAAPDLAVALASPCLGDALASASLHYTPPSAGRLIRPPR